MNRRLNKMASNENSRMAMPLPVKIVWWWYLTLVCASCAPLVFCLVKVDSLGRGELFQSLAGTASLAAYFSGLALAVRRGRRGWATVPYGVVGLLMIMIGRKAIVFVRKSGANSVCKAKYCTLKHIFNFLPYELGEDTYFLTPAGKVRPKGMDETR